MGILQRVDRPLEAGAKAVIKNRAAESQQAFPLAPLASCWRCNSCCNYNAYSDFYFRHLHGDQDTFSFAEASMPSGHAWKQKATA